VRLRVSRSPPIRVLYLDHTAQLSGGELALARLLAALDRDCVEPIVVLAADGPLRELLMQHSIETHVFPLREKLRNVRKDSLGFAGWITRLGALGSLCRYAWRLSRFARRRGVQLVYCNSLKADFYGAVAARLAGVPIIWHIRDRIEDGYLPRSAVWVVRLLARRLPACVVANSASTLETLKLGNGRRTAVIASGLTREHIERCWVAQRSNSAPLIGMVGRIAPWKGQDVFIEAAATVVRQGFRARFCIVGAAMFGEEPFERGLRDRVASLGLGDRVEFLGFSDVPSVLRSLDVLVHASRTPEPFGQVIIEGMAAELPVIATNGGGACEIIENGRTGLLVPMGDAGALAHALGELLAEPGRARALAAAGRRHVLEHFTIEQSARRSEALYERVLANSV
jgi:glycosyltransferase involved in cell wall biosynthesis